MNKSVGKTVIPLNEKVQDLSAVDEQQMIKDVLSDIGLAHVMQNFVNEKLVWRLF